MTKYVINQSKKQTEIGKGTMKKLIVLTVAAISLVAMQAKAAVSVEISAESLYSQFGSNNPIALNTEVLMVVDTAGNGLPTGNLTPFSIGGNADGTAMSLALGGGAPAGDVIVWKGTPNETTGINGNPDLVATIQLGGGIAPGEKVGLLWLTLPASGPNGTVAGATQYYGQLESANFVIPSDGSTVAYDFADVNNSGTDTLLSHTAGPGVAGNELIIPEPSSITLVVMGLFGAVGMIRRRR